ncbi:hypothetical protein VNO80_10481 [Phaseolus coccineus]|uniref:Jacalin-type lectin domain-containing protein n=1 Tax=Phaseolus coccineus TaxID=3886 RepID=A0AAN9N8H1_PHACN
MLQIIFDFPYEVLTRVSGYSSDVHEACCYKVVGFHGRSGLFLDSLGVHAIEGKVIVPVTRPPSTEIISREPTITQTDNPQLPVDAKSAPIGTPLVFKIKLEYPNEVVNCISGYYGSITANE